MGYCFSETSPRLEYNTHLFKTRNTSIRKFIRSLPDDLRQELINDINEYYFQKEFGLKLIARNVFGISYTNTRTVFSELKIDFRKGLSVKTKHTSNFRKEKALYEAMNDYGFNTPEVKRFAKTTSRGVQGYYFNKSTNDYVWLRSTYEYIYAKFLNKIGVNWKTEQTYFNLSDGTTYSPDFYIYDSNWNLEQIVEIKGYYDCRAYKTDLLRLEYFNNSSVSIILIRDIQTYITNSTYHKELRAWKELRKSKEFILSESSL